MMETIYNYFLMSFSLWHMVRETSREDKSASTLALIYADTLLFILVNFYGTSLWVSSLVSCPVPGNWNAQVLVSSLSISERTAANFL